MLLGACVLRLLKTRICVLLFFCVCSSVCGCMCVCVAVAESMIWGLVAFSLCDKSFHFCEDDMLQVVHERPVLVGCLSWMNQSVLR